MSTEFPSASLIEGIQFTAQVGVPNLVQGLFNRRESAVKVASALSADDRGFGLVQGLVRKYGPGPFYVRVGADKTLLATQPDDIRFVLDGSPDPFNSNVKTKQAGMVAFQPDALTLSTGPAWRGRRAFAEAVLDTGAPLHRLAADFAAIVREEFDPLIAAGVLDWAIINRAFQRITRRVILGSPAADDQDLTDELSAMMSAGNKTPGTTDERYPAFIERVAAYAAEAAPGSLASLFADAPHTTYGPVAAQLVHWFFAMGDTLPANLLRALALLATHPEELAQAQAEARGATETDPTSIVELNYIAGCISEAMRLWPTTPMFGRKVAADTTFPSGAVLPAGTEVLIYNVFNHRDRARFDYADRFAPTEWTIGKAADDWSFQFFSNGPQGCPGRGLSMFLGQAAIAHILRRATPTNGSGAKLSPDKPLPRTLNHFTLAVKCKPLDR